jgi:hypothetical protein
MGLPPDVSSAFAAILDDERLSQGEAYSVLMAATDTTVPWAYDIWTGLLAALAHKSGRVRAIAGQVLCNLAKSDEERRLAVDIDRLMDVTHDDKFVTARHIVQSLWKIGVGDPKLRSVLLGRIARRFAIAAAEKNGTLVRYDLLVGMKHLFDASADDAVRELALALVAQEGDEKYRSKYRTVWKA